MSDATVQTNYYNVRDENGDLDDYWEQQFSLIEGAASAALRNLIARVWPMSRDDREALAQWIALQYLRATMIRNQAAELRAAIIQIQTQLRGRDLLREHMESSLGRSVGDAELDAEWDDLTQPGGTSITVTAAEHIEHVRALLSPTTELLLISDWLVMHFEEESLLTSDSLVTLLPYSDADPHFGVGLANAGKFVIPLSRRMGLIVQVEGAAGVEVAVEASPADAAWLNGVTASFARTFVFHHPDDGTVLAGVELREPITREIQSGHDPSDAGSEPSTVVTEEGDDEPPEVTGSAVPDAFEGVFTPIVHHRATQFPEEASDDRSIDLYEWPIQGRTFQNPHAPS